MSPRSAQDDFGEEKKKPVSASGIRTPDRPARSWSLYHTSRFPVNDTLTKHRSHKYTIHFSNSYCPHITKVYEGLNNEGSLSI